MVDIMAELMAILVGLVLVLAIVVLIGGPVVWLAGVWLHLWGLL